MHKPFKCNTYKNSGEGVSVRVRRKHDIPEQRRGRKKLDWNERSFRIHLRRTNHVHFDLLLRSGIFQSELGALRNALAKNDHRAACTHGVGDPLDGLGVIGDVYEHGHPQQHTLRATAFFSGGLPR